MCHDVFLIIIDCLRPDYLGVYDPKRRHSPLIDSLAEDAAVFTEAVTHAPFTTPAIASLLTGMYPFHTGVRLLLGQLCEAGLPSLAEYARRAGFLTAGFPSAFVLNSDTGLDKGFDYYRDVTDGVPTCRGGCWQNGERINGAIEQFLTDAGHRRVFCCVHYFDLHDYHLDTRVPAETSYARDLGDKIDRGCIGGLLDILRRHDRFEDAAVILTADHGECLFQHGERGHGHHLYDSVLRVPLIWRWGKLTASGDRIDRQVRHVDILPTLLQLWGFPREEWPAQLDGRSLVPLLEGESVPEDSDHWTAGASYAEASPRQLFEGDIRANKPFNGPELQSLRSEQYKFILHDDGKRELYDLRQDPSEMNNVAPAHVSLANCFALELADLAAHGAGNYSQTEYCEDDEKQVLQRLHELGYVS